MSSIPRREFLSKVTATAATVGCVGVTANAEQFNSQTPPEVYRKLIGETFSIRNGSTSYSATLTNVHEVKNWNPPAHVNSKHAYTLVFRPDRNAPEEGNAIVSHASIGKSELSLLRFGTENLLQSCVS